MRLLSKQEEIEFNTCKSHEALLRFNAHVVSVDLTRENNKLLYYYDVIKICFFETIPGPGCRWEKIRIL